MPAENLPWHAELIGQVSASYEQGDLSHALGLSAPVGWGVDLLAEQIARKLLALPATQPITETAHPDLLWLDPEGANIAIDEVRAVRNYAVQTPQIAALKIVVIIRAERLNVAASNALLKTLEEPPPNTLIILCSEYWGRVLPTVRSRCQQRHIRYPEQAVLAWLQEQGLQIDHQEFALSGYAPLAALETSLQGMQSWLSTITQRGPNGVSTKDLPEDLVGWLATWYRAVLLHIRDLLAQGEPTSRKMLAIHAQELIEFSADLLHVRRQFQTLNIRTTDLLVEKLIYQWFQVTSKFNV